MATEYVRPSYKPSLTDRLLVGFFHIVNKYIPWHKLPAIIGALNLEALRVELRQYNLHDTYPDATAQGSEATCPMTGSNARFEGARESAGHFNSKAFPNMGCSGMRFGRNFPREFCQKPYDDDLWTPNPRMVSLNILNIMLLLRTSYGGRSGPSEGEVITNYIEPLSKLSC
jgi:hypothetical protein